MMQPGNTVRTYTYDRWGLPTGRKAGTFQNFGYSFSPLTGNLMSRTDSTRSITETFGYDGLNRLTQVNGATVVTYNGYGGIATKSGVGTYTYGTPTNSVSYRLREVNGPDSLAAAAGSAGRSINYGTPSEKAYYILRDGKLTAFDYDEDGNRVRMRTGTGMNDVWTSLHYVGDRFEYDTVTGSGRLWLDGNAYSAPAVLVRSGSGTWQLCYIYRDYLGSITHVTDASGTVLEENSYDPWGRMRDPATQVCYASGSEPSLMLGRGYTGHEWLPLASLVNMNARFYDPVIGVFLAPDPFVRSCCYSSYRERCFWIRYTRCIKTSFEKRFIRIRRVRTSEH